MVALSTQRRRKAFTLVELLVVIVIIGILSSLLLPIIGSSIRRVKILNCAHNQQQLYKLGVVYSSSHKGSWPSATGEDLWLSLRRMMPPLIEAEHAVILHCPVTEEDPGTEETQFRGPVVPFGKVGSVDPLGADKIGNHGEHYGGNVLFKDGRVEEFDLAAPQWETCATRLSP